MMEFAQDLKLKNLIYSNHLLGIAKLKIQKNTKIALILIEAGELLQLWNLN